MSVAGWTSARLGDLATKVGSGATPKGGESAYKKSGTPLIRSMNVVFFGFKRDGLAYLDDNQARALDGVEVQARDVLLNITGASIGRVTLAPPDLAGARVNQHVCIIRPTAALEPRYLSAYLSSPAVQGAINDENYGVTRQALTKQQVQGFEVPVAPIAEQKRIADKLDSLLARVDACRQRLDRVPAILKRFRESVLAEAMSGELTSEWREERGRQFRWDETTLEAVATVGTGSTPSRSNRDFYAAEGTPWITSAATGLPFVDQAGEYVTDAAIAAHRLKRYPVGALLVAMYGEGKTRGQVTELRIEATINQACAAIVADERKVSRAFLKLALESRYLQMRALAEGGAQPNLNLSKVRELALRLPSLEEQAAIVEAVDSLTALAQACSTRLRAAAAAVSRLPELILRKAFRGELVPQDPNDEPASVMLERVRAQGHVIAGEKLPRPSRLASSRSKLPTKPKEAGPKKRRAS